MKAVDQFNKYLESIGFTNHGVLKSLPLIPSHYKANNGDHFIASAVHVCFFTGVDTKDENLGCVTFAYHGKYRVKHCRRTEERPEVFKHVFIPKSANEAIKKFDTWHENAQSKLRTWKRVM